MSVRTYDEINAEINAAITSSDHAALFSLADEMSAIGSDQATLAASHARARAYRLSGEYSAALEQFRRILSLYEASNNRVGLASANLGLGIVFQLLGSYSDALIYYNRSLELNKQLGLRVGESAVLGNIAMVYHSLGCYPEALDHLMRAWDIHVEIGDRSGMANDTCNIGILYQSMGSVTEALEYYQRSLALHEEIGDRDGVAKVTHNIGIMHCDSGAFEQAADHFQRALAINEELGYPSGIAHVTGNYIDLLLRSGDYDAASRLQDRHATMLLTVPSVQAGHFINKARLLEHHHGLQGASDALHEALRISSEAGIREKEAAIRKHLRDLALKQNDLPGYVEHNNEYTRITEEINGKDTAARLATQEAERRIASERQEHQKHLAVLHSTLPKHIADRVARGETVNDHYDNAAVLFLDVVGFTTHSSALGATVVVDLLQNIFSTFDTICAEYDVTKIKTIGDSYMAVAFSTSVPHSVRNDSSVPRSTRDDSSSSRLSSEEHVIPSETRNVSERAASAACAMISSSFTWPSGESVQFRIGLHSGPVVAGVLGRERLQYDVWGDTVNIASRMESTSEPGRIHVSEAFANALKTSPPSPLSSMRGVTRSLFPVPSSLIPRGEMEIKGKGSMHTYWLESPL
ncbi:MAG: hypothetical protein EHM43_11365, partial [Ignavibacteriae bacterium]